MHLSLSSILMIFLFKKQFLAGVKSCISCIMSPLQRKNSRPQALPPTPPSTSQAAVLKGVIKHEEHRDLTAHDRQTTFRL